ncbi:MAG: nucleoside recognition domain-containing protein [Bacillota bacterium]
MTLQAFLNEAILGSIFSILQMAVIIIPIMVLIEILRDINILDRVAGLGRPITSLYKISPAATIPLLAGLFFGIAYGAGVIIQSAKAGKLSARDLYIVNTFLVICHSIVEDTLLFAALGANLAIILGWRVVLAVVVCLALSRILKAAERKLTRTA